MKGADTPGPSVSREDWATSGRGGGREGTGNVKGEVGAEDKEFGFSLEMQIQIKRAEREKKRQVRYHRRRRGGVVVLVC